MLATCIVRALISGECFRRVLKNAMFSLMELLKYIKQYGAYQSVHYHLHVRIKEGNTAGVLAIMPVKKLSHELQNCSEALAAAEC